LKVGPQAALVFLENGLSLTSIIRYNAAMVAVQAEILSVSQLTRRIKSLLETNIGRVWVSGEISNWRVASSGHAYFTLKDANSEISAVMFRARLSSVKFGPDNGPGSNR
jgi:hypothetical protein